MATVTIRAKCILRMRSRLSHFIKKKRPLSIPKIGIERGLRMIAGEWEEQIVGTQEKSQQIVAQRLLSCLQYLDATKSSAKDLSLPPVNL